MWRVSGRSVALGASQACPRNKGEGGARGQVQVSRQGRTGLAEVLVTVSVFVIDVRSQVTTEWSRVGVGGSMEDLRTEGRV